MPPLSIAWDAKAVKWYLKAAAQGNADAQNILRRLGR